MKKHKTTQDYINEIRWQQMKLAIKLIQLINGQMTSIPELQSPYGLRWTLPESYVFHKNFAK